MAGLLKSAAEAIDRGAIIERRALGMDMARGTVAEADATAVDTGRAMDIVRKLALGLQLRKVVAAHLEARRDSRFAGDVLHIMERIAMAGAGFRSITENIDTTTPAGRMMMQMVGAFAEFERAMIRERTSAGLAAARAEGRIGGRRKKLDAGKRKEIADNVISGRKSGAEMARLYNISAPTVSRIVAQHRTSPA
jgi:hypothetical protein